MKEQLANLQRASVELARGFERAQTINDKLELRAVLAEAATALIEMRRAADGLGQQLRLETEGKRR